MKMKWNSLCVLCLFLLLFHPHFSSARGSKSRGSTPVHKTPSRTSNSNSGNSKQPSQAKPASNHPQSGKHENTGRLPNQPRQGGHQNQNPPRRSPYGGCRGGYGSHSGYGGGCGSYGRRHINRNPANRIASPHYSPSAGYGGYNVGGGSPFSRSVQKMGVSPSDESRGFGRSAAAAAAGGAVGGMAMGYGLGRIQQPHFSFNSPQEEYYYKHYIYKKQSTKSTKSTKSTETKVSNSEGYTYSEPPITYDNYNKYMNSCITDMESRQRKIIEQNNPTTNTITTTTTTTTTTVTPVTPSGPSNGTGSNNTAADNSSTSSPSTSPPLNKPMAPNLSKTSSDGDDTVSIVDIGYPALIYQHNVKTCLEKYIAHSKDYNRGVPGVGTSSKGLLALCTSVTVMLLNSNMLTWLHRGPF